MAVTTAEVMVSVANATLGGLASADGGFWSIQAGGLLAPLFHAAVLAWRDMRTVMHWVMLRDLSEAAEILKGARDRSPGTCTAWELLGGAARTAPNELSGYWGSANAALAPYRRESALEVTDRPNFDPREVVAGSVRDSGLASFDTVYINSSGLNQERLAPLIVALLTEIKEARYRLARVMRARSDLCPAARGAGPGLGDDEAFGKRRRAMRRRRSAEGPSTGARAQRPAGSRQPSTRPA